MKLQLLAINLLPLLLFIGIVNTSFGQSANFEDGFEDGNFTHNPEWTGDDHQFTVTESNPNFLLQLQGDSENGGASYLSTPSQNTEGYWEFFINLDFSPSTGNRADIFLMSDISDLEGAVNGYAIRAGENGTDDVFRLIRYEDGSEVETVLSGTTDISSGGPFRVKVTRGLNGNWILEVGQGYDGPLTEEASQTDNIFSSSSYFGVRTTYTSTRANLFSFDFKINLPPFAITGASAADNQIEVTFNRPYDQNTVDISSFSVDHGLGNPTSITFTDATTITLNYDNSLSSNSYMLTVNDIGDQNNEIIVENISSFYVFGDYSAGDIVINEFMADPPNGQSEYIELKNISNKYLDLANWEIGDNTGTDPLNSDPIPLEPDSFLVISPDTTALFNSYGHRSYYQFSGLANLNNTGDAIQLITDSGIQADSLTYTSDWGGNDVALERISASTPGIYRENWGDSPNPYGGTPGLHNEVAPDNKAPKLAEFNILSNQTLQLAFDERLGHSGNFDITNSTITSVTQTDADTVELSLGSNLQNAREYTVSISGVEDLFGNVMTDTDTSFTFYEPSPVDSGDVAINEFMYAPPSNSTEYIELYNHSDKSLDLQGWTLSDNRETYLGIITGNQFIIPPDSFVIIAPDNTIESKYPDIALLTMSDFPALNNGGDQIIIRDQSGMLLDSLEYSSDWGGDEVALERRTTNIPGIYQSNWASAPNSFGTPGTTNEVAPDTKEPTLEDLIVRNSQELLLTFSEYLDKTSANNTDHYSITGNHEIADARFSAPDSVFLTLDNPLENAENYTIYLENITDLFANTIAPTDTAFTFYEISAADSGDVFINEFSFVPPTGSTEYIELYNNSDKSLDLQGWTLSDNRDIRSPITESQYIIPPDSFVVIAPDNTLLTDYPDIPLISMSAFPALNNSGDDIIIRDQNGVILDSLQYSSDWGGNEVALERRTVAVSGTFSENWIDSPNSFGTPGSQNQAPSDQTPPTFHEVRIIDATQLQLTFSEKVIPSSAAEHQNYRFSPAQQIQLISVQDETVTLFLEQELVDGETYEVTALNISDIFGNTLSEATQKIDYLKIDEAQPGDIVINEILYNPDSENQADFVELYNTTDKNFELNNWTVGDFSSEADIEENIQFKSGQYLVLTGSTNFASSIPNTVVISGFPALNNNTPDAVYIKNKNGVTIDSLRYSQSWSGASNGTSLERKDPLAASNDASNWQTNNATSGTSAGGQNIRFQEDTNSPEIIFSKVLPNGSFEVRFNEFIRLTSEVGFFADEQPLSVAKFDSVNGNIISLTSTASKNIFKNSTTKIRVKNLSDVKGNITTRSEIPVAQPLQQGDLVINEIMFNPLSDSDDNLPNQSEYIELRNTRDYALSLEGLVLHDEPSEDGNIRELQPVSTTAKWVPPKGHVLVHADTAPTFEESQTARFFGIVSPNMQSVMRVDRASLSLASTGDAIYIADSTSATIDSVFYDQSWHNPNIIDTRGIALERITPDGPSNDDANWSSSVSEKGGTPKNENSIYQENARTTEETGISFTPNPFSPDDDGHEDNLFINYKLNQQDYLIKVRIYDRYGRLIRTLADGEQAGFEGQLIWDGRKDDGDRNRIGIYIIVFEAYDSASGSDRAFKKTAVLARRLN